MWNAADDWRTSGFIEKNLQFLKDNPTFMGSTSPNCFEGEESNEEKWVTFSLDEGMYSRIQCFLDNCWQSHGIFYSLFRTSAISTFSWPIKQYVAFDWILDVHVLINGPIKRITDELITFGKGGLSNASGAISRYQYNWIDHLFPLNRFTISLIKNLSVSMELNPLDKTKLIIELTRLNWKTKLRTA